MSLTQIAAAAVSKLGRECTASEALSVAEVPDGTTRKQMVCALNHACTSGLIERVRKGATGNTSEQFPTIYAPVVKRTAVRRVSSVFDLAHSSAYGDRT